MNAYNETSAVWFMDNGFNNRLGSLCTHFKPRTKSNNICKMKKRTHEKSISLKPIDGSCFAVPEGGVLMQTTRKTTSVFKK